MKSEHRHDLKTNELADWIVHFPQWARENIKTIIYVSIVVILVIGVTIYKRYYENVVKVDREVAFTNTVGQLALVKGGIIQQMGQGEGGDVAYQLLPYADKLKEAGFVAGKDLAMALANIKRAEALRSELHYRPSPVSAKETKDRMEQAKNLYADAMSLAESEPLLKANAKFGMGLCEEEMEDFFLKDLKVTGSIQVRDHFGQAKRIYTDLATDSQYAGTVGAVLAKDRLEMMDDFQKMVVFKAPEQEIIIPEQPAATPETTTEIKIPEFDEITVPSANEPNG